MAQLEKQYWRNGDDEKENLAYDGRTSWRNM